MGTLPETQLTRLRAEKIGFIFQIFNLISTLSAAENIEAALIPLSLSKADRRNQIAAALDAAGLADRAAHLPTELPTASSSESPSPAGPSGSAP